MNYNEIRKLSKLMMASYGIKIKPENKGKFTDYCGGEVTEDCIQRGKNSSDPAVRKRATFAANARVWKHQQGGKLADAFTTYSSMALGPVDLPTFRADIAAPVDTEHDDPADSIGSSTSTTTTGNDDLREFIHSLRSNATPTSEEQTATATQTEETPAQETVTPQTGELQGKYADAQKALYIKNKLMQELNLTEAQAEGFVVNFNWESNLNPHIVAKPSERGGKKFSGGDAGLCQWTGSRARKFREMYGHSVQDGTLEEQVNYAIWEIKQMPNLMRAVSQAKDIKQAARAVLLGFEGTYDKPDISESHYYDIYRHSISESLSQRLRKAGIK